MMFKKLNFGGIRPPSPWITVQFYFKALVLKIQSKQFFFQYHSYTSLLYSRPD